MITHRDSRTLFSSKKTPLELALWTLLTPKAFEELEAFVKSFKFLKPIFYGEIEEKITKLKG